MNPTDYSQRRVVFDFETTGLSLKNPHYCTLKLSRKFNKTLKSHKLENVARHLLGDVAVDNLSLHRALDDARLTARVWLKMEEEGKI